MELQHQLSNGSWVDCGDRTETLLSACERNNGPSSEPAKPLPNLPWAKKQLVPRHWSMRDATRAEVLTALESGEELRHREGDWYAVCRAKPKPVKMSQPVMVLCDCGCECEKQLVMSASRGSSCPDCYDRMSD